MFAGVSTLPPDCGIHGSASDVFTVAQGSAPAAATGSQSSLPVAVTLHDAAVAAWPSRKNPASVSAETATCGSASASMKFLATTVCVTLRLALIDV